MPLVNWQDRQILLWGDSPDQSTKNKDRMHEDKNASANCTTISTQLKINARPAKIPDLPEWYQELTVMSQLTNLQRVVSEEDFPSASISSTETKLSALVIALQQICLAGSKPTLKSCPGMYKEARGNLELRNEILAEVKGKILQHEPLHSVELLHNLRVAISMLWLSQLDPEDQDDEIAIIQQILALAFTGKNKEDTGEGENAGEEKARPTKAGDCHAPFQSFSLSGSLTVHVPPSRARCLLLSPFPRPSDVLFGLLPSLRGKSMDLTFMTQPLLTYISPFVLPFSLLRSRWDLEAS
ncbi:hypothetical protein F5141DRAFT_1212455 [Pisolithus sp. B1]|nr:hypothetical protein F5141DRAFT_1212455 [Pisolithus sp. B1]